LSESAFERRVLNDRSLGVILVAPQRRMSVMTEAVASKRVRIEAVDVVRGVIMVLMALAINFTVLCHFSNR
jgi:hypothetical protein